MIRQAEISKIAYRLALSEKTIEKDYVLTWVLKAIGHSPLNEVLAFKGGTAIKKMYVPDYRFSEDLDFTITEANKSKVYIIDQVSELFPRVLQKANIMLELERIEEHTSGNFAIYVNYSGPLRAQLDNRALKIDFSSDEILTFPLNNLLIQSNYSDLINPDALITTYSLNEILAEKLRSLLTRSEPRDLFDVYYLLTHQMADIDAVKFNCSSKFTIKGFNISDLGSVLDKKQKVFKQYWHARLGGQMLEIPEYNEVHHAVSRSLSRYF